MCGSEPRESIEEDSQIDKLLPLAGKDINIIINNILNNLKEKMDIICEEMGHFMRKNRNSK